MNLPSGTREILLLALPSADGTHYLAIRDNLSEAGFNDWLLINTSSRTVAFAVGENTAPVVVRPGASAIQRFNLPANEGTAVRALTPIDDRPTVFFTTFWPVRGDRRTIVLFTDEGDAIHVRRIADQLTPVP